MINEKDLIEACKIVQQEYRGKTYKLSGKNHDKRVTVKPRYSQIINKYLYREGFGGSLIRRMKIL